MKHDLNYELEQAKDEVEEAQQLPDTIRTRLDRTYEILENTPPARKRRRLPAALIAAVASVLLIIGSGYISPVMAEALKNIPIIGSIFLNSGDEGLKTASRQGMTMDIDQSVTLNKTTLSISELMYDGGRISMVLSLESKDSKSKTFGSWWDKRGKNNEANTIRFYADGEELNFGYGMSRVMGEEKNSVILTFSPQGLPDAFDLGVVVWHIEEQEPFTFNIPVKISAADRVSIKSEEPKIHDNIHMNIDSLTITPATMQLIVSISGKPGQDLKEFEQSVPDKYKIGGFLNMDYEVVNEKGDLAQSLGGSGYGSDGVLRNTYMYEPFPTKPKSITIKPYVQNSGDKMYIPELEFHMPVEE